MKNRLSTKDQSRGKIYLLFLIIYLLVEYTKFQDVFGLGSLRLGLLSVVVLLFYTINYVDISKTTNRQILLICIFCLYLVLFVPFARNNYHAFNTAKTMLIYLPAIYSIVHLLFDIRSLNRIISFFIFVSFYLSIYVLTNGGYGPGGTVGDANDVALVLVFFSPFVLFFFSISNGKFQKAFYLLTTLLVIAAIAYTKSRGGVVGLSIVIAVYFMCSHHKVKFTFLLIIILSVFIYTADDYFLAEISSISDTSDATASSRLLSWKDAWKMFLDNPLGVGPGNFPIYFEDYQSEGHARGSMWGRVAHSLWFTLLPETGVLGAALFLYIILGNFKDINLLGKEGHSFSMKDQTYFFNLKIALLASLCGFLASATFISVLYYQHFWILTAIIVASRNIYHKQLQQIT